MPWMPRLLGFRMWIALSRNKRHKFFKSVYTVHMLVALEGGGQSKVNELGRHLRYPSRRALVSHSPRTFLRSQKQNSSQSMKPHLQNLSDRDFLSPSHALSQHVRPVHHTPSLDVHTRRVLCLFNALDVRIGMYAYKTIGVLSLTFCVQVI